MAQSGDNQKHMPKRYFLIRELCGVTRLSRQTIYQKIKNGEIQAVRVLGVLRIPCSEFCRICNGEIDCDNCVKSPPNARRLTK
jgi:excisionase family DNA binding protein